MTKTEARDFVAYLQKKDIVLFPSSDAYDSKLYLRFEGHNETAEAFERIIMGVLQKFNLKKCVYAHTCSDKTTFPVFGTQGLVVGLCVFDIRDKSIRNQVCVLKEIELEKPISHAGERRLGQGTQPIVKNTKSETAPEKTPRKKKTKN